MIMRLIREIMMITGGIFILAAIIISGVPRENLRNDLLISPVTIIGVMVAIGFGFIYFGLNLKKGRGKES